MRQTFRTVVGLLALALTGGLRAQTIDLGTRTEMFVDRELIASTTGDAALRLNPPTKREIVLTLDRPWESPASAYYALFRDGDRFRLYYRGRTTDDDGPEQTTCYAESTDGVHFTRPNLGLYEFDGSKDNNICYRGPESAAFAPFKDANPAAKPDERYKAICYRVLHRTGTVFALASPDGLRWHRMSESPVLPPGSFDSLNTAFWDPQVSHYRLFGRYWTAGNFRGVRNIQSSTSDDFLHWTKPVPNEYPAGAPLEHFYTNAVTTAPGVPHILLSFPMRFVPDRKKVPKHTDPGVSDALFMAGRDGIHWDRSFTEPWVRPGPDERNWTERSNMPAWGILDTAPDEWSMYVSEHYRWPDNRLRRVTIPRGRFASIHAGPKGGELLTKPITFSGHHLVLNYATTAAGSVRVEIQDPDGKPLATSDPLYGDEFDAPIPWPAGTDLGKFAGHPVRLRFILQDADVYAFHFGE